MAIISCHVLDSVFGSNASGIGVKLLKSNLKSEQEVIFDVKASDEGRIKEIVNPDSDAAFYELVFDIGNYIKNNNKTPFEIALPVAPVRFYMKSAAAHYHFSIAFTPAGYSLVAVIKQKIKL